MAAYQKKTYRQRIPKGSAENHYKPKGNAPATGNSKSRRKNPPANLVLRRFQKLVRKTLRKLKSYDKRLFFITFGVLALSVLIAASVWLLTNKNAFEVYLSETKIGIVKKSDDITMKGLETEAVAKLMDQIGAKVAVNETIRLTPVHAGRNDFDSVSYIISEISKKFTYKVEAAIITVGGVEMAVVKNINEAEQIKKNIIDQYIPADSQIIESESGFVEDVQVLTRFVEKSDIVTNDAAYTILTARRDAQQTYTAVSGDSYWSIASKAGITQDKLFEINPDLDPQKPLRIGQQVILTIPTPVLSVKTVEKTVLTEAAYAETQYLNNPNQPKNYSRVIQQGKDGQKEVTYHNIRVNGALQEKKEVDVVFIADPVPEIIEVGTR